MTESETTRRTDAELIAILDDAAAWAAHDEQGKVAAWAPNLRMALAWTAELGCEGRTIVALTQGQNDRVIVFRGQMERLREAVGDC